MKTFCVKKMLKGELRMTQRIKHDLCTMGGFICTANVNRQTTDKLLFSLAIITDENV